MLKRLCCMLCCVLSWVTLVIPASAQSYSPPQRTIRFQITGATPMKTPSCDKVKPYVKLSISRGATQLVDLQKANLPHSDYGKGGISGYSAVGFPICIGPGQDFESFGSGPFVETDELACMASEITFRVQLYDEDDGNDDEHIDHAFTIDFSDPASMNQMEGCRDEGDDGKVCWKITLDEPDLSADADRDGLTDEAELHGVDVDCNGTLVSGTDLFLHQMGVNPNHKDMLVEMNWFDGFEPPLAELQEVQAIFARAPVDAGGAANPDGTPGVNLIIDAGAVLNDVGVHELGGRVLGPSANAPTSGDELDALVATIEAPPRVGFFRTIVFGPLFRNGMPATDIAGRSVGNDRMQVELAESGVIFHELGHSLGLLHGGERPQSAGSSWPEFEIIDVDGNGIADAQLDVDGDGLLDLGVDINGDDILDAWGVDRDGDGEVEALDRFPAGQNCKPNHLSSMNYLYGEGIAFETGAGGVVQFFDDFSPSKIPDALISTMPLGCPSDNPICNRRIPLLPDLDENQLDQDSPLVNSDASVGLVYRHIFRFYDPMGTRARGTWVDYAQDWDGDPSTNGLYAGNIDVDATPNPGTNQGCGATNNAALQRLVNVDEWSRIVLPPVRGAAGEGQVQNAQFEDRHPPFSKENRARWRAEFLTTDLSVEVSLQPERISVGQPATLFVEVANLGPGPASDGWVSVQLPLGVTAISVPSQCSTQGGGRYDCSTALPRGDGLVAALRPGQHTYFEFVLDVEPNVTSGQRDILVNTSHQGPETNYADNSKTAALVASPAFLSFEDPDRPWLVSWSGGTPANTSLMQSSHGDTSLSASCGNQQLESPSFDTAELELLGEQLVMDVLVPGPRDPWYVGKIQAYLDVPSGNLWNLHVGLVDLASLSQDSWTQARFSLSAQMQDVLKGDYPDARIRLEIDVAGCAAPVYVDNLRLEGDERVRDLWHPSNRQSVIVSSALSFDSVSDWSVPWGAALLATETEDELEGAAALRVDVQNWARLESRELSTDELHSVTSLLALDVHIPDLPADFYWLGQVNAFLSCPEAGLYNEYVGYQALQILFDDEYNQLVFELSPRAVATLRTPGLACRFAFELSADAAYGPFLLDNAGFVQ